ncbi:MULTISPECIES: helix-turn-helix domain-containing protein [Lactiplantibacillus]|uniref:helix-turn-helix domain-containing protein n=1 Tax=Lactiplantibacillus TaxID=2767842 RepID=UPI003D2E655E
MAPKSDDILRKRIINLLEENNWNQSELSKKSGLENSKISKIFSGTRKVSAAELDNFAKIFNVSSDYLLGKTNKRHYYDLTEKDKKGIDKELEDMMNGLDSRHSLSFFQNGQELSDQDKELLKASMRQTLELSKQLAKRKFTPKKYRNGEE